MQPCSVHSVDRTNLPNQPVDVLKKRIQGGKPQNSTRLTVSLSLFHETFLTSSFRDNDSLKQLRYNPTAYKAEPFTTDDPRPEEEHIKVSTISKRYIMRNLRWKRAKRRNSTSVTRRLPTTSSYATRNHTSSYLHHQRHIW